MRKVKPSPKPRPRKVYIREWRQFRGFTLEQVAARVGTTHATISRIERGLMEFKEDLLGAIAEALGTDSASLLIRDPSDPDGIWTLWDRAKPAQRKQIVELAQIILKTGT